MTSDSKRATRRQAKRWALAAAIVALPFLALGWFIAGVLVYFQAGGDFGGIGRGPEYGNVRLEDRASVLVGAAAIGIDAGIAALVFSLKNR